MVLNKKCCKVLSLSRTPENETLRIGLAGGRCGDTAVTCHIDKKLGLTVSGAMCINDDYISYIMRHGSFNYPGLSVSVSQHDLHVYYTRADNVKMGLHICCDPDSEASIIEYREVHTL